MKSNFKFFKGYIGTIDIMDSQTYATASIYNPNTLWTPQESERRRIERMEIANDFGGQMINHTRDFNDNPMLLYRATTTITVNPTLWTKIKIFGTGVKLVLKSTWKSDPMGIIVMTLLSSVLTFIGIMKLFGA